MGEPRVDMELKPQEADKGRGVGKLNEVTECGQLIGGQVEAVWRVWVGMQRAGSGIGDRKGEGDGWREGR